MQYLNTIKTNLFLLFIILSVILYQSHASDPIPRCQAGFYYKTLPLIANEAAILNLDTLFDGYNLNFELKGS